MSDPRTRALLRRAAPPSRAELQSWVEEAGLALTLVPPGPPYEASVCEGRVPTREGSWHDAFNVLAFVAWPLAKRALHARVAALQAARRAALAASSRPAGPTPRSREEDALTLLDETVLVVAGPERALAAFAAARSAEAWGDVTALIHGVHPTPRTEVQLEIRWFGHALLEHLALRRPPVGAGVLLLRTDRGSPVSSCDRLATVDAWLANDIASGTFDAPRFGPTIPWPQHEVLRWVGLADLTPRA